MYKFYKNVYKPSCNKSSDIVNSISVRHEELERENRKLKKVKKLLKTVLTQMSGKC